MRAAVIGAGAMGTIFSYLLHAAGIDVTLYERRRERIESVSSNGIRLRGDLEGWASLKMRPAGEPDQPFDMMVMAVSAVDTGDALRSHSPFVHRETFYLSLQEGNAVEELAQLVGSNRTMGATSWVSALEEPDGWVEIESFETLSLGALGTELQAEAASLVESLEGVRPGGFRLSSDPVDEAWKRMRSAAAVSGLCSILGAPPAEVRKREEADALCKEAAAECDRAAGWDVGDFDVWGEATWKYLKPPMLIDIELSRATEVDYLSRHIVQRARSRRERAPCHSAMASLIDELESEKLRPGENCFKELRRRVEEEKRMPLM